MIKELKPCPFCGSTYVKISRCSWEYSTTCYDCGASVGSFNTKEEAEEAWNLRANYLLKKEFPESKKESEQRQDQYSEILKAINNINKTIQELKESRDEG